MPWEQKVGRETEKVVIEFCGINTNDSEYNKKLYLLDFGCGSGRYLEIFAKYLDKEKLWGVEIAKEKVIEVKKRGFNCVLIDKNMGVLPFKNDSFDIVFSSNVIEHIPRELYFEYLDEIYRILKVGGRFVVGTPNYPAKRFYDIIKAFRNPRMFRYYLFDDPTHCNKMSINQLESDLKKYFSEVYLYPSYIFLEGKLKFLKNPELRNKLRIIGDKISGYCVK